MAVPPPPLASPFLEPLPARALPEAPESPEPAVWPLLPEELGLPEEPELLDELLEGLLEGLLDGKLPGMPPEDDDELEDCDTHPATTTASTAVPRTLSTARKRFVIMMLPRCQPSPGIAKCGV